MTFNQALQFEDQNLTNVINQPVEVTGDRKTYIGPTRVWFYLEGSITPDVEAKLFKKWKENDSKFYSNQVQTQFWY